MELQLIEKMKDRRFALVMAAALLAGCAAPDKPAPVVHRRDPGPAAPARAPAPAAPSRPAPAEPVVQAAPARTGSGVEVRPLPPSGVSQPSSSASPSPAPAPSAAAPSAAANGAATPVVPGALRTQPKALKRPYSPSTLSEMQAADAGPATAAPEASSPPQSTRAEDSRAGADIDFAWPSRGRVVQGFADPGNPGLTFDGTPGDPVLAAADGRVIFSGPGPRGYGNLLIIKHDAETVSVYAHNRALLAKEGQTVKRGQRVAELGDTGSGKPNLHFEIRKQGRPIDPAKLLPKR